MIDCPHCGKQHERFNHFCPLTGEAIPLDNRMKGQVLLGKYVITEFLGPWLVGGTFKAKLTGGHDRFFALKMVHPYYMRNSGVLNDYTESVKKWMDLNHPNIAKVIEIAKDEAGVPIIVREYIDGIRLDQVNLDEDHTFALEIASWITMKVLEGLSAIHEAGIVSGRLTGANIFLLKTEENILDVKITDFCENILEKIAKEGDSAGGNLFLYRSPEQVRESTTEMASDIYSVGVLLYRMLTGKYPYPQGIPQKPEKVPAFIPACELKPNLPSVVDYNLRRAMAIFPRDRFKNASQFSQTLHGFLPHEPIKYSEIAELIKDLPAQAVGTKPARPLYDQHTEKTARHLKATIKMDIGVSIPPPEIATGSTQKFDAGTPAQIKEAIERHSLPPSAPPTSLEIPYDSRPDAWKEERKLIPRSSKPPTKPPVAPAHGQEKVVFAPPPSAVDVKSIEQSPQEPIVSSRSAEAVVVKKSPQSMRKVELQEESLAPIMPTRHLKWFIAGAVALGVIILVWGIKSFIYTGKKDNGLQSEREKKSVVNDVKQKQNEKQEENKEMVPVSSQPETQKEEGKVESAVDSISSEPVKSEVKEPVSIIEGIAKTKETESNNAPILSQNEKRETITISLMVKPQDASVFLNGKQMSKPYDFKVEKSSELYTIEVRKEGYVPQTINISATENKKIDIKLEKQKVEENEEKRDITGIKEKPAQREKLKGESSEIKQIKHGKKSTKSGGKKKGNIVEEVPF